MLNSAFYNTYGTGKMTTQFNLDELISQTKTHLSTNNMNALTEIFNNINHMYQKNKFYEFWGVDKSTNTADIQKHIKTKMRSINRLFHPDRHASNPELSEWATKSFALINTMASTLSNDEERAKFEEFMHGGAHNGFRPENWTDYTVDEILDNYQQNFEKEQRLREANEQYGFNLNDFNIGKQMVTVESLTVHKSVDISLKQLLTSDVIDICFNLQEPSHSEMCLSCMGAGCNVCNQTGKMKTEQSINTVHQMLANHIAYQNGLQIKLEGCGFEKLGLKGDAIVTMNIVNDVAPEHHIRVENGTVIYSCKIDFASLCNGVLNIQILDKSYQVSMSQINDRQYIELDNQFDKMGRKLVLELQPCVLTIDVNHIAAVSNLMREKFGNDWQSIQHLIK